MKKNVVLLTGHYYNSKRKAGFHHIAETLYKLNYNITFVTVNISYLSLLRYNYRFEYPILEEKDKLINQKLGMRSYVHFTLFHPLSVNTWWSKIINGILTPLNPLFIRKKMKKIITQANIVIFESTPSITLFRKLKKINPAAKYIYRVSDDLELLNAPDPVISYEKNALSEFDLVSVPSKYIFDRLPDTSNKHLQFHAISKKLFDEEKNNPYTTENNVVFIGNSRLDEETLNTMVENFPHYKFHVIGPIETKIKTTNIHYYGEMKFEETVPYLKFADIGLVIKTYEYGAESYTDCLKVIQYTYCNLSIVAPSFLKTDRKNTFYYEIGNVPSICSAMEQAMTADRSQFKKERRKIEDWTEFTLRLIDA